MLDWMKEILDKLLHVVVGVFPTSPFLPFIQELGTLPYLGYINWFLPISEFIAVGALWLTAIAAYYMYMVIARWVKLLGD